MIVLHPPTLAYFTYSNAVWTHDPPPRFLTIWASVGGAPCQGLLLALAYALADPGLVRAIRVSIRPSTAAAHADGTRAALAHTDSRHVHFNREQLPRGAAGIRGGGRENRADPLARVLAEQRIGLDDEMGTCQWWWMTPVVAAVGTVVTVVLLLQKHV